MLWFKVWFGLAALMLALLILTHAQYDVVGLCFLAWIGGVASTLMVQEQRPTRLSPLLSRFKLKRKPKQHKTGDDGDH